MNEKPDNWVYEPSDPIQDCKKGMMLAGDMSEREAEIMVEGLTGKRKLDVSIVCALILRKLRRTLD